MSFVNAVMLGHKDLMTFSKEDLELLAKKYLKSYPQTDKNSLAWLLAVTLIKKFQAEMPNGETLPQLRQKLNQARSEKAQLVAQIPEPPEDPDIDPEPTPQELLDQIRDKSKEIRELEAQIKQLAEQESTKPEQVEIPTEAQDCTNVKDYFTDEDWSKDSLPDIKIAFWNVDDINKKPFIFCAERESLTQWIDLPDNQFRLWVQKDTQRPIDADGHGGAPINFPELVKLPNGYYADGRFPLLAEETEYIGLPLFKEQRIGNPFGSFGVSELHGQLPGQTIYDIVPKSFDVKEHLLASIVELYSDRKGWDLSEFTRQVREKVADPSQLPKIDTVVKQYIVEKLSTDEAQAIFDDEEFQLATSASALEELYDIFAEDLIGENLAPIYDGLLEKELYDPDFSAAIDVIHSELAISPAFRAFFAEQVTKAIKNESEQTLIKLIQYMNNSLRFKETNLGDTTNDVDTTNDSELRVEDPRSIRLGPTGILETISFMIDDLGQHSKAIILTDDGAIVTNRDQVDSQVSALEEYPGNLVVISGPYSQIPEHDKAFIVDRYLDGSEMTDDLREEINYYHILLTEATERLENDSDILLALDNFLQGSALAISEDVLYTPSNEDLERLIQQFVNRDVSYKAFRGPVADLSAEDRQYLIDLYRKKPDQIPPTLLYFKVYLNDFFPGALVFPTTTIAY